MDQIATPEINWSKGYSGQPVKFIDSKTLAYVCGNSINFSKPDQRDVIFTGPDDGIGAFDVHAINKHFAFAGQGVGPKIFIHEYPTFNEVKVLEGGAVLEYQTVAFSASEYLITLSGLPDFKLTVWNYVSGEALCSEDCSSQPPRSLCVNPGNWRQVCLATERELSLWTVEQSNTEYTQKERHLKLSLQPGRPNTVPSEPHSAGVGPKVSTSKLLQVSIPLPKSAMAGLVGQDADTFEEANDGTSKSSPVSLAWTPSGDIIVGCARGEILSINSDTRETKVLFVPVRTSADNAGQYGRGGTLLDRNMSIVEVEEESEEVDDAQDSLDKIGPGSAQCLGLHKKGVYMAGKDGFLRLLSITNDSVSLIDSVRVGLPVSTLGFSSNYKQLALGTRQGTIHLHNVDQPGLVTKILDNDCGKFVGLGVVAPGNEYAVTLRDSGQLQCWYLESGECVTKETVSTTCTALISNPVLPIIVVGTALGYMFVYDYTNIRSPRLVFTNRLYAEPIRKMAFDPYANYLFVAASDETMMIISGLPSEGFKPLGYVELEGVAQNITTFAAETPSPVNVVVSCATPSEGAKGGASKCVSFTLTEGVMKSVESHYASLKADMRSESINKLVFNFSPLVFGASLGGSDVIFSLCQDSKMLQKMYIPQEKPKKPNSKDSYLVAEEQYECHQLPGGASALSPHQKWLATVSPDGRLSVRSVGALDKVVSAQPSDHRLGGLSMLTWSSCCQHIVTAGEGDSILACYKWQCKPGGDVKLRAAAQASKAFLQSLASTIESESAHMYKMTELKLNRRSSLVDGFGTRDALVEKALANDEIFTTPAATPKADSTWIQARKLLAISEEDKQFATAKKALRTDLREIRRTLQGLLKQNDVVSEMEKLSHHEFDLDIDEQHRLQAKGDAEVARIREEIEFENLAKIYLRELIKEECWDNMAVKGRSIKGFKQLITVNNFPMKKRSQEELAMLQKVMMQRKIEMDDLKARRELVEHPPPQHNADEGGEEEDAETYDNPAVTGSLGASYGGKSQLFYSQFELNTRDQKTKQIVLLQDAIYRIKESFNKEFDEAMLKKEQELAKINERNKRIRKIYSELGIDETMESPVLSASEKPESLLTVEDSEVSVERYLSPEQLKVKAEEEAIEAERILNERGDNARERALDMMMGGVLEVKKEDELKVDIPVPAFLSKPADDWSEEEKKAAADYERKVKELNEEREKYRKQLEAELKKLQHQMVESEQGFNDALRLLFNRKLSTDMVVYQEELKVHRLQHSLLFEESLDTRIKQLKNALETKKTLRVMASEAATHAKTNTEAFREQYDILVAEDKVMDKSFKRDFSDVSPIVSDQLYKLFRRRPRQQRGLLNRGNTPMFDPSSGNPFADRPSTAMQREGMRRSIVEAVEELNRDTNMPEGCELEQWKRMCDHRAHKIASEQLVKQKALILADMIAFQQKRQEEEAGLGRDIDDIQDQLTRLDEDKNRYKLNLEVQLLMKQGQVEINPGPFIHDYGNSILVHRSTVEDLNMEIKELGNKKIESMMESKDFRKGIIQLEWEHKKNLMKVDDLKNKMRDINMMKVTREIQAFLNEKDHEGKIAQEVAILEQTILMQKKHHEANVAEKKKILHDLRHTARDREFENRVLMKDIEELNVSVNERQHLDEVSGDQNVESQRQKRYQEIVQRRKLVDLAKAQANEVAVLRAEVERLRMRTFPALVQVER